MPETGVPEDGIIGACLPSYAQQFGHDPGVCLRRHAVDMENNTRARQRQEGVHVGDSKHHASKVLSQMDDRCLKLAGDKGTFQVCSPLTHNLANRCLLRRPRLLVRCLPPYPSLLERRFHDPFDWSSTRPCAPLRSSPARCP